MRLSVVLDKQGQGGSPLAGVVRAALKGRSVIPTSDNLAVNPSQTSPSFTTHLRFSEELLQFKSSPDAHGVRNHPFCSLATAQGIGDCFPLLQVTELVC